MVTTETPIGPCTNGCRLTAKKSTVRGFMPMSILTGATVCTTRISVVMAPALMVTVARYVPTGHCAKTLTLRSGRVPEPLDGRTCNQSCRLPSYLILELHALVPEPLTKSTFAGA